MPPALKTLLVVLPLSCAACGPGGRSDVDAPPAAQVDALHGPDAETPDYSRVYAHSGTDLYRIDTVTLTADLVGTMTGLGTQSMTDIAIDRDDHMVGITLDKLYSIDPATGATVLIKDLSATAHGFSSLSYVPMDLADPQSPERLVAANTAGEVYEIDPVSGNANLLGSYGTVAGGAIGSSGDLVAVSGFGIYATVTIGLPLSNLDYLARIDPVTWAATPLGVGTDYDRIFGIGFWRGKLYGFVDDLTSGGGKIVDLDPNTGASTLVLSTTTRWYGAGVTTDAPIIE